MKYAFYVAFVVAILDGLAAVIASWARRDDLIAAVFGPVFVTCLGLVLVVGTVGNVVYYGGGWIIGVGEVSKWRHRFVYIAVSVLMMATGMAAVVAGIWLMAGE